MRSRQRRNGLEPAGAQARCAWCGPVPVGVDDLRVHVRGEQGLFEFRCPDCARLNIRRLEDHDSAVLAAFGVRPATGPAPFELTEVRSGPPIGWDDLIDLHLALRATGRPGRRDGPQPEPGLERDAA